MGGCDKKPTSKRIWQIPQKINRTLACKHCLTKPKSVSPCIARMFYIVHCMQWANKVCIHLGFHDHRVAQGECNEIVDTMKKLVKEEIQCTPCAKVSTVTLILEKTWMSLEILGPEGHGAKNIDVHGHVDFRSRVRTFTSSNVCNKVSFI